MIAFNFNLQLNHQTKSSGIGSEANFGMPNVFTEEGLPAFV